MNPKTNILLLTILFISTFQIQAQEAKKSLLTLDRIYNSDEFQGDDQRPISWIDNGNAFITIEKNNDGADELVKYLSKDNAKSS